MLCGELQKTRRGNKGLPQTVEGYWGIQWVALTRRAMSSSLVRGATPMRWASMATENGNVETDATDFLEGRQQGALGSSREKPLIVLCRNQAGG